MNIFKSLILFLTLLSLFSGNAQKVTYNHLVDPENSDTKKVMAVFEKYLASNPEEQKKNSFWNQKDQQAYKRFDFLEGEFQPSLYMGFQVHVLSIKVIDDAYQIKAQFGACQEDGTPYVLAIINYYVKKEKGEFRLFNALHINRKKWKHSKVGLVDFYYPKYHTFDEKKARKLNDFIVKTTNNFKVEPVPIVYYFADDYDEIQELKGIDYYIGMGGAIMPAGKAGEKAVYGGGMGEYYPHEAFHVEIDPHFPNKYFWVSEGLATFLGGSRGKDLNWHLKRTNEHLKKHPEIDLNNLLDLVNLDKYTSYHYALGGLIAQLIYEKGGWPLIRKFMNSGDSKEGYYQAIEDYLGVKRENLNEFLRQKIEVAVF